MLDANSERDNCIWWYIYGYTSLIKFNLELLLHQSALAEAQPDYGT